MSPSTAPGTYTLTARGREAAEALLPGDLRPCPARPGGCRSSPVRAGRRLARLAARRLRPARPRPAPAYRDGAGDPAPDAPDCDISPAEQPVTVPPGAPGGPERFRVTPHQQGTLRLRLEVLPAGGAEPPRPAGGIYFDLGVAPFPTPACAQFQTLAATVALPPGREAGR